MRRCRVYVGAHDLGFDFVAIRVGAGSRVVDGVEQREKLRRLVALAERGRLGEEAAMEGRLPRGFCIKRLTDLPMLWSEQWRAIGLQAPVQFRAELS